MNPISDEDLVLYHYRDGLDPARLAEIDRLLATDPELSARYQRLASELATAANAFAVDEPDAGFEARIWNNIEPRLPRKLYFLRRIAPIAALAAAITLGIVLGRMTFEPEQRAPLLDHDASERVLAAYVSEHLATTERALLIAANSPNEAETARELARALIATNRLYAIAAERAQRPQLVRFLRELEPVLLQLANSELPEDTNAIGESIRRRDLPFKTRAAAAALSQSL